MNGSPTPGPNRMNRTRMQIHSQFFKKENPLQSDSLNKTDGRKTLSYFIQILDVDTVCSNSLRKLKEEINSDTSYFEELAEDDWRFSFSIPIPKKY